MRTAVSSLCRNQGDRAYILTEPCVGSRMAKGEEQEQKTALSDWSTWAEPPRRRPSGIVVIVGWRA